MKNKSSRRPKNTKLATQLSDLSPQKDPKAAGSNPRRGTTLASVTDLVIDPFNSSR